LLQANDCPNAVAAWATSDQQGVVRTRPQFWKVVQDGYAECEKRGVLPPARFDPAVTTALQQLNQINGLARTVVALGEKHSDIWTRDAAMREQYDRAVAEITSARKSYGNAQTSRAQRDFAEVTAAIERARAVLVSVEASLNAAVDNQRSAQALMREVGDAIAAAEGLERAVAAKKVPFTPQLTTAYEEGRAAIGRARERLAEGAKTLNTQALALARSTAVDASTRLKLVLDGVTRIEQDDLRRQIAEAVTRAADTFSLLDNAVATLDRFASQRPGVLAADKETERAALQKQVALARRRFEAARRGENAAAIAEAAQLAADARDRLNLLIAAFGPLTLRDRGVHEVLERGAALYFDTQYEQAAATLAEAETFADDVPLRLHAHLFRAAALYELSLRSGGGDAALRQQALAEVAHCKAIDSAFEPDATAFSPRFRAFYREAGIAPSSAVQPGAGGAPLPR
jgi:hypothetical protein